MQFSIREILMVTALVAVIAAHAAVTRAPQNLAIAALFAAVLLFLAYAFKRG